MSSHLSDLAARFGALESLADTSRAQTASDSPLSGGALSSFGQTMMDALQTTAILLRQDRMTLAQVANRYRSVDEQSARSAEGLTAGLFVESRLPTLSAHQSQLTRAVIEGFVSLDDAVVPFARSVTGSSDQIQTTLLSAASQLEQTAGAVADDLGRFDPVAGASVRVVGAVSAETFRAANGVLEAGGDLARGAAELAQELSDRADRVLIRPVARSRR